MSTLIKLNMFTHSQDICVEPTLNNIVEITFKERTSEKWPVKSLWINAEELPIFIELLNSALTLSKYE